MVKETLNEEVLSPPDRTHLYVYPGHFERSGLERNGATGTYDASATLGTETQYMVAGARIVWARANSPATYNTPPQLDRELRMTYPITNLLGSSSAVIDLYSGELLEATTYYPNGAVETQRTQDKTSVQLEALGFTGKEADDEVGVVYFGERYLIPRVGRWASADPLHVHAVGGGEALNSYHYVGGNILQAADPLGLDLRIQPDADLTQVMSTLQSLTTDRPVLDRKTGRIKIGDGSTSNSAGERGTELVRRVIENKHVVTIDTRGPNEGARSNFLPTDYAGAESGHPQGYRTPRSDDKPITGSGGTITWVTGPNDDDSTLFQEIRLAE